MKKHIDLFAQLDSRQQTVQVLRTARLYGYYALGGFFGLLIIEVILFTFGSYLRDQTVAREKEYTAFIAQYKTFDTKLRTFITHNNQYKHAIQDDTFAYNYYTLLRAALDNLNTPYNLTAYSISPKGAIGCTFVFNDYGKAEAFLQAIETKPFFEYFDEFTLVKYDIVGNNSSFVLEFKGIMKPVYENVI